MKLKKAIDILQFYKHELGMTALPFDEFKAELGVSDKLAKRFVGRLNELGYVEKVVYGMIYLTDKKKPKSKPFYKPQEQPVKKERPENEPLFQTAEEIE